MSLAEMKKWQQKTLLRFSLKVIAPTGQYDPTKLINLGTNRWAFKPELGYSRRWGHWLFDAYASVWVSLDGNFWYGGRTSLDGVENPATLQKTPASA